MYRKEHKGVCLLHNNGPSHEFYFEGLLGVTARRDKYAALGVDYVEK